MVYNAEFSSQAEDPLQSNVFMVGDLRPSDGGVAESFFARYDENQRLSLAAVIRDSQSGEALSIVR